MKKSILLLLCSIYFSLQVLSQDYKVIWGNPNVATEKMDAVKIIGKDKTGIYILANEGSSIHLVKYDLNLNFVWRTPIELKISKTKVADFVDLILTPNKTIFFSSIYDEATQSKKIYATYISSSGLIDNQYQEIHTFKNISYNEEVFVGILFDKEKSSIFLRSSMPNTTQNNSTQLIFIGEDLTTKISQTEIKLPILQEGTEERLSLIDDSNNFYAVYSRLTDPTDKKNTEEQFYLLTFEQQTKETREYKLNIGNYKITDQEFLFDTLSNNVVIFGYYSDKIEDVLLGTYSIKIDLINKKIESTTVNPFDPSLIDFVSKISITDSPGNGKNKPSLKDYGYRFGLSIDKEQTVLIYEQYNETLTTAGSPGSVSTYHYKDVLITKFDEKGIRKWSTIIPKYQQTLQEKYGSIGSFIYKNEIYVMYMDNPSNGTTISPNRYVAEGLSKSSFVCVKIDENGKMKKSTILPASNDRGGVLVLPTLVNLIDNEVFLIGFQSGNFKIGKIVLP